MPVWFHARTKRTSVRRNRGLGKEGNRYLRKALYMPALVAIKYNAPLRHFASHSAPLANLK